MIRVRFAPSPTGHLHIGGVRTALFNFLYARSQSGRFFLRIEDTDRERSRIEYEKEILAALKWLALDWDGDVWRQSERLERYREVAAELLRTGRACEEKIDGKTAVKFKMPSQRTVFHDLVRGEVEFDASLFGDLVILKSDGYPTYQLACVVDDHDMEISHVIRGEDHLSNTPRQILIFEALGWQPPKYAHLPLILGADGAPLSKRHGAVSLDFYRAEGFLPEGILNYLALLGWGPADNEEFFRREDLIKKFTLKRINKAGTQFDPKKFEWINFQHMKRLSEAEYLEAMSAFHAERCRSFSPENWRKLVGLYRPRVKTLKGLADEADYFFREIDAYPQDIAEGFLRNRPLKAHLVAWLEKMEEMTGLDFKNPGQLEEYTRNIAQGWGIEAKDLIHPLRFALTGRTASPGLFELMSVLGRQTCLDRLKQFLRLPKITDKK